MLIKNFLAISLVALMVFNNTHARQSAPAARMISKIECERNHGAVEGRPNCYTDELNCCIGGLMHRSVVNKSEGVTTYPEN